MDLATHPIPIRATRFFWQLDAVLETSNPIQCQSGNGLIIGLSIETPDLNSWAIANEGTGDEGVNVMNTSMPVADGTTGGGTFKFSRDNSVGSATGYGVPVRFTVDLKLNGVTSSTSLLTCAATSLNSTTLTVPGDTMGNAYTVVLTKVECPWF